MKTVLLFSSVFYLLGLKIGNTIEVLKKVVIPVRTVITAPAARQEKPEKTFFYKPGDTPEKKKAVLKESTQTKEKDHNTAPIQGSASDPG